MFFPGSIIDTIEYGLKYTGPRGSFSIVQLFVFNCFQLFGLRISIVCNNLQLKPTVGNKLQQFPIPNLKHESWLKNSDSWRETAIPDWKQVELNRK